MPSPAVRTRLAALLDDALAAAPVDALIALHVLPAEGAPAWQHTAGRAVHGGVGDTLRIASITKSYVAAAVLRLMERGAWSPDDAIAAHLPPVTRAALEAAGYDTAAITLRMLLDHTSGLPDFVGDEYVARLLAEPGHVWSREEQLALALRQPRLGAPGERYEYCDTNYSLLGEVLERATGLPLAAAVRAHSGLRELGLRHTWFETLEPVPADAPPRLAQVYQHGEVPMPVADFHASADLYGAGGLLSTLPELARYFRALVDGELFAQPATAAQMRERGALSVAAGGMPYGLGLEVLEADGTTCWGHSGFWGVAVWHDPAHGVTFALAVSNTALKDAMKRLQREIALVLARG